MNRVPGLLVFCVFLICIISSTNAQDRIAGPIVICPAISEINHFHIPTPIGLYNGRTGKILEAKSTIEVQYVGFSPAAREAFQYAVEIWQAILKSDVKIRVLATWEPLGAGTLGAAGATSLYRNFENAPRRDTWFPVSLAEKLSGTDLNEPGEYDIVASFNSSFANWYFGTDGNSGGFYDLVTVVLHELGHGLGFVAGDDYFSEDEAYWDLQRTGFPLMFSTFLESGTGERLIFLQNGSSAVADFLTSRDVFMNSPLVSGVNGGFPARIFAPSTYNQGSSISHWDESRFNNTVNALMTPQVAPGEVLHDPGPLTLSLFADLGWFRTLLQHNNVIVAKPGEELTLDVIVSADTSLNSNEFKVVYSYDDGEEIEIPLIEMERSKFRASIEVDSTKGKLFYYFTGLKDAFSKSYRLPEVGTYIVDIREFDLFSIPFSDTDGGDFEDSEGPFGSVSSSEEYQLWEWGETSSKFGNYSGSAWMTRKEGSIGRPSAPVQNFLIGGLFNLTDTTRAYYLSFDYLSEFTAFDRITVSYSLDTGKSWRQLGSRLDGFGVNWFDATFEERDYFGVSTRNAAGAYAIRKSSYPLFELVGHSVLIRFEHDLVPTGNTNQFNNEGVLIDNFEILIREPTADFFALDTGLVFVGTDVRFRYASSGATGYLWDFGDGVQSVERHPVHRYVAGGTYTVKLKVFFDGGVEEFVREDYIKVIERKESTYTLEDGGNFENNENDFIPLNVSGTPFERGKSTVSGKDGTTSGDFAWVTGLQASKYINNSEAYLLTPEFDFTTLGTYHLKFKTKYEFEDLWEGFIVEYTTDRGKTWIKLDPTLRAAWYNAISDPNSIFGRSVPLFTGTTNGVFVDKHSDVSFLSGNLGVSFRFKFLTDPAEVAAGMALDDFELIGPVLGAVSADFSSQVSGGSAGCSGMELTFSNKSLGSVREVNWVFGDGAIPAMASGIGPHKVVFTVPGVYNIYLTATDFDGHFTTKDTLIIVSEKHAPVVLSTDDRMGTVTLSVDEADSYQWFLENEPIEGATAQTYLATQRGRYSVSTTIGSCTVTASQVSVVAGLDLLPENLKVYPNPTASKVFLSDETNQLTGVRIFDLAGKQLYQSEWSPKAFVELDVNGLLLPGLYLMVVETVNGTYSTRIQVE